MIHRIRIAFLLLILSQGLHSVEEYYGQLWERLAPARFLSSLVSSNPEKGFVIINIGLFVLGIVSWLLAFQKNRLAVPVLLWIWIVIEMINGIGHPFWCIVAGRYVPGVITAPFLLLLSIYLIRNVVRTGRDPLET